MLRLRLVPLWGPVLVYAGLIFGLSGLSTPPGVGSDVPAHAAEYGGFGLLLARAVAGGLSRVDRRAVGCAWLIAAVYGATDEWHQSFVPNRDPSVKDWIMDVVGAAVGTTTAWAVGSRARSRMEAAK